MNDRPQSATFRIMTCNIRCYGAWDEENNWEFRGGICAEVIRSRRPDVFCVQEMWKEQSNDMVAAFPEYGHVGTIDEPAGRNPVNTIFCLSERFEIISAGAYWLSETPHVCGSRSWDSACPRLVTWVTLTDLRSQREFRVCNTHLDHMSQLAREGQAAVINRDAAAWPADYPQFLTGDLNARVTNPAIISLKEAGWQDTWEAVHGDADPGITCHGFRGPETDKDYGKIDWIFWRGNARAVGAEIVRDSIDDRYPSDHYFVSADVELT